MNKTLSQETNATVLWGGKGGKHVSQHPRVHGVEKGGFRSMCVPTQILLNLCLFNKKHIWALGVEFLLFS